MPTRDWLRFRPNKGKASSVYLNLLVTLIQTAQGKLRFSLGFRSIALLARGMTESNQHSNLIKTLPFSVAPEDYLINKAKIADAKALLSVYEEMNEASKSSHDEFVRELEQKIREGEQARYVNTLRFHHHTE